MLDAHFFFTLKIFSEIQLANFTKRWHEYFSTRSNYCWFILFLAQIRKYVLIFANVLHISIFPDSLAAPCLGLDVQTFCG